MGIFSWIGNRMKNHQENSAKAKVVDVIETKRPDLAQYYLQDKHKTDVVHGADKSYVIVWDGTPTDKDREIISKKLKGVL